MCFEETNARRMFARRLKEERMNKEIPPQVEQLEHVPKDGQGVKGA